MTSPTRKTGKEVKALGKGLGYAVRRSVARLAAVQALYQMELTDASAEAVVKEFCTHRQGGLLEEAFAETDLKKFESIVSGVSECSLALDEKIAASLAQDWTMERLGPVLRAILRSAAFELFAGTDVPAKVVINEYVNLTHAFFEGKEPGFVNGLLDRLARELRQPEMQKATSEQSTSSG